MMFIQTYECENFAEWLKRTIEATAQWRENCKNAAIGEIERDGEYMRRAATAFRAETVLETLKDVEEAYSAFQK